MTSTTTILEDQQRHDYLEALYSIDGRHDRQHPSHGVYTGLFQQRQQFLLQQDISALAGAATRSDCTA